MGHPCLFLSFAFLQLCDPKKRKLLISTGEHVMGNVFIFHWSNKGKAKWFKIGFNDFVLCWLKLKMVNKQGDTLNVYRQVSFIFSQDKSVRTITWNAEIVLDFLKVRFHGSPVRRKTDFSQLQRAIFYRPDFRSAVWRGCGSDDLQSESLKLNDIIFYETLSSYLLATLRARPWSQNFASNNLDFADIGENQRKVVETYLNGRVVLTISPTGSGISLTFHIAPNVCDRFLQS